ncbi:MAG: signal peptide peptidase SppA [Candidatus Aureabacteria bacterium]|nr:signal peptide peptidase SppA [Candidatus Auribacterota bacterium]
MNDTPGRMRKVLKWAALGLLLLMFAVSIFFNIALSMLVIGQSASGSDAAKFREFTVEGEGPDKAALIPIRGLIGSGYGDSLFGGRGMVASILSQLKKAAGDNAVKAVILEIDSPGGSVGDSDLIYHEVQKIRKSGKPVVSFLRDVATSGAYYVAVGSDKIIAQPTTITGNIGVIVHSVNVEGLFQKLGIREVIIKKGRMKDLLSPTRPLTPEEEQLLQGITDEVFYRFATVVASQRKLSREQMSHIADGRIFLAPEALRAGLVDAIGYRDESLAAVRGMLGVKKIRLIRYEKLFSLREMLSASSHAFSPLVSLREGMMEAAAPKLMYLWTID